MRNILALFFFVGCLVSVYANDGARSKIKADQVQSDPMFLTGQGVKIGIWDIGTIYQHQGFFSSCSQRHVGNAM